MSFFREIFVFNRAEIFALAFFLFLLCIGGGILLYQKMTQTLPPELFFETNGSVKSELVVTPKTNRHDPVLSVAPYQLKLNLNTCPVDSLILLPYIGSVIGVRIIEYRESHNGFDSVGQLVEVKGIGSKRLATLRKYFTTE